MTRQGYHGYTDRAKGHHHHAIGRGCKSPASHPYKNVVADDKTLLKSSTFFVTQQTVEACFLLPQSALGLSGRLGVFYSIESGKTRRLVVVRRITTTKRLKGGESKSYFFQENG